MNVLITALLLTAVVAVANGAQTASLFCRYTTGSAKVIEVSITKSSGSNDIIELVGTQTGGTECVISYTAGTASTVTVEDSGGSPVGAACGASAATPNGYKLNFRTSSCLNCIIDTDEEYEVTCPFTSFSTDETKAIEASSVSVTSTSLGTGSATPFTEEVTLTALLAAGTAIPGPVALGTSIILRAELTFAGIGYATGVSLVDCLAEDSGAAHTVNIIGSTGCTATGLAIIPADNGFKNNAGATTASVYTSDSPAFPAFVFVDKGGSVLFKCTAKFCYGSTLGTCTKSCATDASRKRRAADDDRKAQKVMVLLRVSTDNTTSVSVSPAGHGGPNSDECSNRTYVIGLAVLGCVLVLTFIVTVGMFVVLRGRRHGDQCDKVGYANKCVS